MERVIKLIVLKSSLILFAILLSVSAAPTSNKAVIDTTDLKLVRLYNEQTLKKIDHEFQRAAQFKER